MSVTIKIRKDSYRIARRLSLYVKSGLEVVLNLYKDDFQAGIKLYNLQLVQREIGKVKWGKMNVRNELLDIKTI